MYGRIHFKVLKVEGIHNIITYLDTLDSNSPLYLYLLLLTKR